MKISYSFTLPTSQTPTKPQQQLVEHAYSEFMLSLPEHWVQVHSADENTLTWQSDVDDAAITISADFYQVPDEKADAVAEFCLDARHRAMESRAPEQVSVFSRSKKPHSQGFGLELSYAAQIPGHTYLFLGYVTSRKVFNVGLTCGPNKQAAIDLFNKTMSERLRVKLP